MVLSSGARFGSYEVIDLLGKGGMGEVYRARDTKLGRDVAVKTLPEAFARDADRLARSEREARLLASLNHPNIGAIYGLEEHEGAHLLVLELVEGPTLADRLREGPLPVDEALELAHQIAEGLRAAHEKGVIHRDLKPANVKVTPEGQVKVLDFGLAKDAGAEAGDALQSSSPTWSFGSTQQGMILGTAAYMSPEQAKGRAVDERTDVWAFGCVLYEMLTGRRPFEGEDAADTLANILKTEPDWTRLPADLAPAIHTLLRRCLEKDRRRRIADFSSATLLIEEAPGLGASGAGPEALLAQRVEAARRDWTRTASRRVALVGAATLVAGSAIGAAVAWLTNRPAAPAVRRLTIATPAEAPLKIDGLDRDLVLTPDGSRLVYAADIGGANRVAVRGDMTRLVARPLDAFEATALGEPIVTTRSGGGAQGLFCSPDGQWIGYFENNNELKRVAITGGPPIPVVTTDQPSRGATWAGDDTIVFATRHPSIGLQSVPVAGGAAATVLTRPDAEQGEADHLRPEALPGGRLILFTITPVDGGLEGARIAVLDLSSGRYETLLQGGSHAHYVSTGHLVYTARQTLLAVAFDLDALEVRGTPVVVVPDVQATPEGGGDFSVASDGTLVYVQARELGLGVRSLVWVDQDGQATPAVEQEDLYSHPRLSPDEGRVAVTIGDAISGRGDVWSLDLDRGGTRNRLTFGPWGNIEANWSVDGRHVTFRRIGDPDSTGVRGGGISRVRSDGSGDIETLIEGDTTQSPEVWTPDGETLVFLEEREGTTGWDIRLWRSGQGATDLLAQPFDERDAALSPDGRWMAYSSNESGRDEVYVRPFPGPGARIPISSEGGRAPVWSRDGTRLFYRDGYRMMSADVEISSSFRAGIPRLLFEGEFAPEVSRGTRNYDVAADGRFLMVRLGDAAGDEAPRINVVLGWGEELKRQVPVP